MVMNKLILNIILVFAFNLLFNNFLVAQIDNDFETKEIVADIPAFGGPTKVVVEIVDDDYLFDGDIMVKEYSRQGGITNNKELLWANSTIPYKLDSGHVKNSEIKWAIEHIENKTNLCFVQKTDEDDYVEFVKPAKLVCSSYIGRQGGRQKINISRGCGKGAIVHEILHAAGFYHEQSRDDRDDFITVNINNVKSKNRHNFKKYNQRWWHWFFPEGKNIGKYDYGSIMHYGEYAFSIDTKRSDPNKRTIVPKKKGVTIGQRLGLSTGDIATVNKVYKSCAKKSRGESGDSDSATSNSFVDSKGSIYIDYNVQIIPQPTGMSCWAAGLAMLVAWRDGCQVVHNEIKNGIGYWKQYVAYLNEDFNLNVGLSPDEATPLLKWGLQLESPQSYTVEGFANLLGNYGPLWVASAEGESATPHIRVIAGMRGDGTPDGTLLTVYDPWEKGMSRFKSSNKGAIYEETYQQFLKKQEELAQKESDIKGAIYIVHP